MDPSSTGKVGQVITYFDEAEFRNRNNESLVDYLASYLDDLKSDHYELQPNGSLQLQ